MADGYSDPQDFWQGGTEGAGYSEMDMGGIPEGYRPFDESLALGRDFSTPDFQNAPWAGGPTQDLDYGEIDPYLGGTRPTGREATMNFGQAAGAGFGAGAAGAAGAYGGLGAASGGIGGMAGFGSAGLLGPIGLAGAGLFAGLNSAGVFDKKKKRGTPGWLDTPSYQGYQFEPAEGFPAYYEQAQEITPGQPNLGDTGFQYQQPNQQGYDYNYTGGGDIGSGGQVAAPSGALANASQQNYVGQQEQEYGSFYNRDKGGIYDTFTV